LSPEQVAQAEQLQKLSGADFDRNYMTLMVQNHRNNLNTFQNERRAAHSPEVVGLINQDLVTIQNHLTLAQQVGSQVGADVSGGVATVPPQTDTTSVIRTGPPWKDTTVVGAPTIPSRKDTTLVGTQIPKAEPTHDDDARGGDRDRTRNIKADAEFIRDVDAGHFLEIRLGRLAREKGRDPAVKRFGEKMEQDHTALQRQWSSMASRNGMNLKSGMGPNHRAKLDRLEKVSGRAFDRAYMTLEIQNNQDYLNYWRKEGRAAHSAPVRQLVNQGIPTLEEHMDLAKRVGRQVGVDPEDALAGRRVSAKR
jgi:putative membrane protein